MYVYNVLSSSPNVPSNLYPSFILSLSLSPLCAAYMCVDIEPLPGMWVVTFILFKLTSF